MDFIDFLAGFSLVLAMPHLILGTWNRKMYSPFGKSPKANIIYSYVVIAFSIGLLLYKYGTAIFMENGIYVGGFFGLFVYLLIAPSIYKKLKKKGYIKN